MTSCSEIVYHAFCSHVLETNFVRISTYNGQLILFKHDSPSYVKGDDSAYMHTVPQLGSPQSVKVELEQPICQEEEEEEDKHMLSDTKGWFNRAVSKKDCHLVVYLCRYGPSTSICMWSHKQRVNIKLCFQYM